MAHPFPFHRSALALAAFSACSLSFAAAAQTSTPNNPSPITVTGRNDAVPAFSGFAPLAEGSTPLQTQGFSNARLQDSGATRVGDLVNLDASVGNAYNAPGYWSLIAVRGYTLDNRFNYRRDGLPINAETAIALDNKAGVELLKGSSGLQAGTSAPGGLVNFTVKRPVAALRSATVGWREQGSLLTAVDLSDRAGAEGQFGWRVNAAYEHLDPRVRDTQGHRRLVALAADWRLSAATLLEAEMEDSLQQQPSVTGFSLRGNNLPAASSIDPDLNLNRQPWNGPVRFAGRTASLRLQQRLNEDWRLQAHAMAQRLKTDDRTAFPYGVYDANYECPQWCDRFAPDGSFTYWQFTSLNERRNTDALDLGARGRFNTGGLQHQVEAGVQFSRYRARFEDQVFDIAGTGRDDGSLDTPPSAGFPDGNTNRTESSRELYLRDAIQAGPWGLWLGLRHTRLERDSIRTRPSSDGLRPTAYGQTLTTPWLAASWQLTPQTMAYASWGQGMESEVAPGRPRYSNAGQALPALKSTQQEIGLKHRSTAWDTTLTLFDIDRPVAADIGIPGATGNPDRTRQADGSARHRGLETSVALRHGGFEHQVSVMALQAERRGSVQAGVNGQRPVNVPEATLRASTQWRPAALPGLALQAAVVAEGDRLVLPYDASVHVPGWARLDLSAQWQHSLTGQRLVWRAGVDNVGDVRAWKETPYQFDHAYLYPLEARTWRVSVQISH